MLRVGIGYDIHKFSRDRRLFLGGVEIPYEKGLLGHSDADVIIHAVCDALLGAVGEDDIGRHFPDSDEKYRGVSSIELLKGVFKILKERSFSVVNVDVMLLLETPKISRFKDEMRSKVAGVLAVDKSAVAIKVTTHEGLGEIGRSEAAAAYAAVLVESSKRKRQKT